jgi:hypothetical protein
MLSRAIALTSRQRRVLHHLLHREVRKCSAAALESITRLGWCSGPACGYQLTDLGWRLADLSESAKPLDRTLELRPELLEAEPAGGGSSWNSSRRW